MTITIEDIRELCTKASFERGMEYFYQGFVKDLRQSENDITAVVKGAEDYKVIIRTGKKDLYASCTCPYDRGGYCKHIVAVLAAASGDYNKTEEMGPMGIEEILEELSPEELKEFLMTELERDPSLRERFTIYFSDKGQKGKNIQDYKRDIDKLFQRTADRSGYIEYGNDIDFYPVCSLAERYFDSGNYREAAVIYQALSEVIAENMEMVDDSGGHYGTEFSTAIDELVNCINCAEMNDKENRRYIKYLFDKYIKNDPDYFQEYYDYALRAICKSEDTLDFWKTLIEPHLPDRLPTREKWTKYYQAKNILLMQVYILEGLNSKEKLYDLLRMNYRDDEELCIRFATLLMDDSKTEEAVKVAEEGLGLFPGHITEELRRFLDRVYESTSPQKYRDNLIELFLQKGNWSDYEKIKSHCSRENWRKLLDEIIQRGRDSKSGWRIPIIDIYLKEEMYEKALKEVLERKSLHTLSEYQKNLANKFPGEYFAAYRQLIISFAGCKLGRSHYRNVAGYLVAMKNIKGFDEDFDKLLNQLKSTYSNRKAFIDEIERCRRRT